MIMNMSIEKMLSHVYEIEGLMLVTRRLGDENTPDVITNKIKRKVRELAEMYGMTIAEKSEPQETPTTPEAQESPATPENPATPEIPATQETQEVQDSPVIQESPVTPAPVDDQEDDLEEPVADPQPVQVTPPPFMPPVEEGNGEPVPEPDPEVLPEDDRDLEDITVEFIEAEDNTVPEPEEEMPIPPVPTEFPEVDEAPLRVDEKLQRNLSKDIRKAFSINDRFLFQRELFAGSASAMNTAIEHIEMMRSYGNAELYFYSQLHWDRENEVVQSFMSIVRNHFQS